MDTCICPQCNTKLDVGEDDYGFRMECSECHCKIDVFPDPIWVKTKWGTLGIPKNILSLVWGKQ